MGALWSLPKSNLRVCSKQRTSRVFWGKRDETCNPPPMLFPLIAHSARQAAGNLFPGFSCFC